MRLLTLFVFLSINSVVLIAQPSKSLLSGPIIAEDSLIQESFYESELSFLPNEISIYNETSNFFQAQRGKPGVAMISSAIIPGSGQALNGKWGRAAVYLTAEIISIAYYLNTNSKAKDNERAYEQFANQNWSPLAYAKWLVDYSRAHGLNDNLAALTNLENLVQNLEPDFENTTNDWDKLGSTGLNLVRTVEVRTPFILEDGTSLSEFSHVLQDYGSQQYYELMSKYYQFQPGWEDFYTTRSNPDGIYFGFGNNHIPFGYTWDRNMITSNFIEGRNRAEEFNDNYRQAGNILKFLVVNHVVSAFDAFFTVKLKNSRIETQANMIGDDQVSLIWHF